MVGVFSLELLRLYGFLYQKTGKNFSVIHALDGYDEISLTGTTKLVTNRGETTLDPEDFGVQKLTASSIGGGDSVEASAKIFMNVIQGKGSESQHQVVCANAGMAIATALQITPKEGFEKANESLISGKAFEALNKLQKLSAQ